MIIWQGQRYQTESEFVFIRRQGKPPGKASSGGTTSPNRSVVLRSWRSAWVPGHALPLLHRPQP